MCSFSVVPMCLLQTTLRSGHLSRFRWSTQMNSKVLGEIILIYYLFVYLTFWLLTLFCRILLVIYLCIKLSNFEFLWVFLLLFLCVFVTDALPQRFHPLFLIYYIYLLFVIFYLPGSFLMSREQRCCIGKWGEFGNENYNQNIVYENSLLSMKSKFMK